MSDLDRGELRIRDAIAARHRGRDRRAVQLMVLVRSLVLQELRADPPGEWQLYPGTRQRYRIEPVLDDVAIRRKIENLAGVIERAVAVLDAIANDAPMSIADLQDALDNSTHLRRRRATRRDTQ